MKKKISSLLLSILMMTALTGCKKDTTVDDLSTPEAFFKAFDSDYKKHTVVSYTVESEASATDNGQKHTISMKNQVTKGENDVTIHTDGIIKLSFNLAGKNISIDASTSTDQYLGIFNDTLYEYTDSISKGTDESGKETTTTEKEGSRKKVVSSIDTTYEDQITLEDAKEELALDDSLDEYATMSQGREVLKQQGITVNEYSIVKNKKSKDYTATFDVYGSEEEEDKTTSYTSGKISYTFVKDKKDDTLSFTASSVEVLNTSDADNYDSMTHTIKDESKATIIKSAGTYTYGERKKATILPDEINKTISTYFTQSIKNERLTDYYQNTGIKVGDTIYDSFFTNDGYLPETASDDDSIVITGSSDETVLKRTDSTSQTFTALKAGTASLYFGNSFNPKITEVEITVVE